MKINKTTKEYEQLGKVVASIFETGYLDKKQAYKTSFIKGVIGGVGSVVGATIVAVLLVWILSLFGHVPLIGKFANKINKTVETSRK
jgi:branched-subunit amino acid ABC-type transport system permease component